jgi:hypothetical protein
VTHTFTQQGPGMSGGLVFGPRNFGVSHNCWPPNGASVVLSEGQCEHGVLQDSWKAMGR